MRIRTKKEDINIDKKVSRTMKRKKAIIQKSTKRVTQEKRTMKLVSKIRWDITIEKKRNTLTHEIKTVRE